MLPSFRKTRVLNADVKNFQDAVAQIFNQILKKQIIDGVILEDLTITSGTPLSIDHGLNTLIRGWIVIRKNASSNIYESASDTPTKTLILNASSNVTISLWVF
jgi:hypothetical protein